MQKIREYLPPSEVNMVVYHKSCSDGFCAAFCVYWYRKLLGLSNERDIISYIPRSYLDDLPEVEGKNVLVLDFSFKRDKCIELMSKANRFALLDHHKSAMDDLSGINNENILFDMDRSGAMMAWDYCFPDKLAPEMVKLVQDRDLWRWELEGSKDFSVVFMDTPFVFEEYEKYLDPNMVENAKKSGRVIREYVDRCVTADAKHSFVCKFLGYNVRVLNCTRYISEVGNEMVNMGIWSKNVSEGKNVSDCIPVDFAVLWRYDQIKHKYVFSLRGNGRVDTSEISKRFGGGGHPNASGFTLDSLPDELV